MPSASASPWVLAITDHSAPLTIGQNRYEARVVVIPVDGAPDRLVFGPAGAAAGAIVGGSLGALMGASSKVAFDDPAAVLVAVTSRGAGQCGHLIRRTTRIETGLRVGSVVHLRIVL